MLPVFSSLLLAQTIVATPTNTLPEELKKPEERRPVPQEVVPSPPPPLPGQEVLPSVEIFRSQEVRPLPGSLDEVPVFNSNSPEIVRNQGVLLSSFPPDGKRYPEAHLNFAFEGRFDIFSHHIARARHAGETRTLFQGILLYNPNDRPVTVKVLQGASYLTRPDALFIDLPAYQEDPLGNVYAGPGSRVVNDVLRRRRQGNWPPAMVLQPGESRMLMNLPIPVGTVTPSSNGRTALLRMSSSGPIYIANLAMFAPLAEDNTERLPTLEEWIDVLINGNLVSPRDIPPTPPNAKSYSRFTYGRVAGIAQGSQWKARITDDEKASHLTIPKPGQAFSYGLSLLPRGTLGTGQVQSAKMVARYADTAYLAHGNYGIQYSLTMPLFNPTDKTQTVTLTFQTPLKSDRKNGGLLFFKPPEKRVFFRGPVRLSYEDDQGRTQTRFVHIVQLRGELGRPLLALNLKPGERRLVKFDFLYPADSTPPQVLTVRTLDHAQ